VPSFVPAGDAEQTTDEVAIVLVGLCIPFHVRYRPSKENAAADAISRLETDGMEDADRDDDTPTLLVDLDSLLAAATDILVPISREEMRDAQSSDAFCHNALHKGSMYGHSVLEDEDDLIVMVVERVGLDNVHQIIVPDVLRRRLLTLAHQPQASAHPGASRLFWSLLGRFVWPGMSADITSYLNDCPPCCTAHLSGGQSESYLHLHSKC
jgi:Integrase zinc binding domain